MPNWFGAVNDPPFCCRWSKFLKSVQTLMVYPTPWRIFQFIDLLVQSRIHCFLSDYESSRSWGCKAVPIHNISTIMLYNWVKGVLLECSIFFPANMILSLMQKCHYWHLKTSILYCKKSRSGTISRSWET